MRQRKNVREVMLDAAVTLLPGVPLSVEQYARIFAASAEGQDMRFVAAFDSWVVWHPPDGVWITSTPAAVNKIGDFVMRAVTALSKPRDQQKVGGQTYSIERRLRDLLASTPDEWDTNPMLLNTPGGTVDLESGTLREHDRDDRMTKSTSVGPGGPCPVWLAFLDKVFRGDQALIAYMQRVAGYCATGRTDEQALFFLYGSGQNGKGTFLHTLAAVLKDYASAAAIETFTSGTTRHAEELAVLRGARLVHAAETEQHKGWNEARIKLMTGGDEIRARFMRQNSFVYTPTFKLAFLGNHRPALASTDKAMRRRLNLVPFDVEISEAEKDPQFEDRLKIEHAGILAWIVEGARLWSIQGLAPPSLVSTATEDYVEGEDVVGAWIEECCFTDRGERGHDLYEKSARLFADPICGWAAYAKARGENIGTLRGLSNELIRRKFPNFRRGFKRIALRSVSTYAED